MKAFKGFDKDLRCRGFQYEIGEEYEESKAILCNRGFHACERPLDVLAYYPPATSRYCKVDLDATDEKNSDDTKRVGKKIKIEAELTIANLVKAHIEHVKENCIDKKTAGYSGAATAGDSGAATAVDRGAATAGYGGAATAGDSGAATAGGRGAATAGYRGAATAGYGGAATAGDRGAATAGDSGAATAGNYGAATAGDGGAATAGDGGAATAGYMGAATAGDSGAATAGDSGAATAGNGGAALSKGKSASGDYGVSVSRGLNVICKGGIGALLVIAEENKMDMKIKSWCAGVVDGKKIKADTWYKCENGNFVEVEDEK